MQPFAFKITVVIIAKERIFYMNKEIDLDIFEAILNLLLVEQFNDALLHMIPGVVHLKSIRNFVGITKKGDNFWGHFQLNDCAVDPIERITVILNGSRKCFRYSLESDEHFVSV